jgi:hypothetical protein
MPMLLSLLLLLAGTLLAQVCTCKMTVTLLWSDGPSALLVSQEPQSLRFAASVRRTGKRSTARSCTILLLYPDRSSACGCCLLPLTLLLLLSAAAAAAALCFYCLPLLLLLLLLLLRTSCTCTGMLKKCRMLYIKPAV